MNQTVWMDGHCHLSDPAFDAGREDLYKALVHENIHALVLAGTDPEDWLKQERLALPASVRVARAFGLHPWSVDAMADDELEAGLRTLQGSLDRCVGLGELGLDYFRAKDEAARTRQKHWFERQLEVAREAPQHPLILHIVRAHHDALPLLRRFHRQQKKPFRGLIHSFWGHPQIAADYIALGFRICLPPRLLKEDPHGLLENVDREHIVFETDSPFHFADGSLATPVFIKDMLKFAADRWNEDIGTVCARQNRLIIELFPSLRG